MIKRLIAEQKILWIAALLLWVACFAATVLQLGGVLCIFSGMYVVSMICLSKYWFFNTFVLGAVISLAVCIGGTGLTINYNNYRGVSYDLIDHGIDPRYQYIYPFFIVLILAAVGILKQKRDFMKKAGVEA